MVMDVADVLLIPLMTGLVEAGKRAGLPARYAVLVSVACGVILSVGAQVALDLGAEALYAAAVQGAALGLAASGLYSATRAVTGRAAGGKMARS